MDIVNHANNHAFDYGALGWRSTRDALAKAKVAATGAPGEIKVINRRGTKVAFAGFSTYRWTNPMDDDARVRAQIERAAGQADIVVAFLHAGAEGETSSTCRAAPSPRSASTAATAATSRGSRSTPAPTSCSAPARTSCAGSSSTRAG